LKKLSRKSSKGYTALMNTKFLEKYTIRLPKKKPGPSLLQLAKKHAAKAGKGKKVTIAARVDQILYGAK
jgi:hypothetical protein